MNGAFGLLKPAAEFTDWYSKLRSYRMDLRTTGMEFASEMVVRATLFGMRISEVPTTLSPDGRSRPPHLRSWRHGWRHLRFVLMYSPRWILLYPGLVLMLAGSALAIWLLPGARKVHGIELDIHTVLYAVVAALVGFQTVLFAVLAKVFAITAGLLPKDPQLKKLFRIFTLEVGLGVGVLLLIAGIACALYSTFLWKASGFGAMDPSSLMRSVACAAALTLLGVQGTLSSLFFSILGLAAGRNEASEALQSQKAGSARKCSCAPKIQSDSAASGDLDA